MKSSRVCWRPGPSGFSRNKYTRAGHIFLVTILTLVLLVQRLQPLLGRNARGFRRDALGEYTLYVSAASSSARA